jgi:hypothetical protein
MAIADAEKAVRMWILDRGRSWGHIIQNMKTRLQLQCTLSTCSFGLWERWLGRTSRDEQQGARLFGW